LDSRECLPANIITISETKDTPGLVIGHQLLDLEYGRVHVVDIIKVTEHEGGGRVETYGDDVFGILIGQPVVTIMVMVEDKKEKKGGGVMGRRRGSSSSKSTSSSGRPTHPPTCGILPMSSP